MHSLGNNGRFFSLQDLLQSLVRFFTASLILFSIFSTEVSAQDCGKITIYRPPALANSLVSLSIYIDDVQIYDLPPSSMLVVEVTKEAAYRISARWFTRGEAYRIRTTEIVSVACGNEYFVEVRSGALDASVLLQNVGPEQQQLSSIPLDNVNRTTFPVGTAIEDKPDIKPVEKEEQPVQSDVFTSRGGEESTIKPVTGGITQEGRNYALIIGINSYQDARINDLDQPYADAEKLRNVLIKYYTFNQSDVLLMKDPTKNEITAELDRLYKSISKNDNLLIFYAGHGYWDEQFKQGYWLPSDANQDNRGTWLSNGTIRDYVRAIPSRHTLLVTDACFGGGIFKSRAAFANSSTAINQLYRYPSRKAMTSGAMSEVPDNSVFVEYLVKRLENNTDEYLSSEQLFSSFKIAVINNSANAQVPQFGEIRETGDEGGDFIFIRKK